MSAYSVIALRRELLLCASPQALWPLIANTERFNRALGLPAVTLGGRTPGEFTKRVKTSLFGLEFSWREPPFEWVEGRFFSIVREFDAGPLARFEGGMTLVPEGAGCRLRVAYDFTPRNALGSFLARHVTGKKAIADAEALLKRFDVCLKDGGTEPFPARRTKSPSRIRTLALKAEALRLSPADKAMAERLIDSLSQAYDDELHRMRPFELADRWGQDRVKTLAVFFHAVKAGLLDMNWEILCPNCSAAKVTCGRLDELVGTSHCSTCEITYGVNFDESVELRFSASPTVRQIESRAFCVGSPAQAPFAAAQLIVLADKPRTADVELAAESYLLRDLKCKRRFWLRPSSEGLSEIELDLSRCEDLGEVRFRPGTVKLTLRPAGEQSLVRLEKETWREKGAKASIVTSLQEFRDMFSSEVLAPGVEISVRTIAILFSDLKGSTALYERIGDATAYSLVRDHFDYLFEIVKRRNGAVVKTIGDAVMAIFPTAERAVEAAFEMQERIAELNARLAPKPSVVLKLGVHQGPAIVIGSNDKLDYFGTTVNIAARVQNESRGGDIVVTEAVLRDPCSQEAMARRAFDQEDFELKLKGLSDVFRLRRLSPRGLGPSQA